MQPIFFSFASGLHYRKTVKLYFRRIATFDLVVSICENMLFQRFSSFLTAGNKSYCGTLQRLTHPQQSTAKPIFRPVSSPKRQAMQGKSLSCRRYTLELLPTCENIGLQSHLRPRNSQAHSSAPNLHPRHSPSYSHSRTPDTPPATPHPHPRRPAGYAPLPTPKSHVIPPGPHSPVARKPRNINDLISKPETPSGELRAKLLGGTRVGPPEGRRGACGAWPRCRWAAAGPGRTTHSHKPRPEATA